MRRLRAFVIAWPLFAVALSSEAPAQTLWQNTAVGMTADQIRAAQPSARLPAVRGTLRGGATCELEVGGYEVSGERFDVCFFLRDGSLSQAPHRQPLPLPA